MSEPIKLLIIDDEEIVINSCRKIFKRSGYQIEGARSGEEGIEKLAEKKFDIVVTDLKMPGIGGLEALRRIKERDPNQIVIVFTGYANVGTARESLKLGAFDYVPKPFTPEELRDVIANAVKLLETRRDSEGKTGNKEVKMLDLMAIVAHEIKSPVATVHTTAETLYGGYFGNLSPEQQNVIESIMRNCQYLEDIIRCYMDLSKMELDGLDFFKKKINLVDEVVRPVIETTEYKSNLKNMRINLEFEEIPPVMGDTNLLKIVVNNLVNNAIKYGYPSTEIKVSVCKENANAVVSVHNEGVGISNEDMENRLFKRFERLKQKGSEGVKGSGLGLYICKTIIEKHGGKIEVLSEVGKYATFRVHLKLEDEQASSNPNPDKPEK